MGLIPGFRHDIFVSYSHDDQLEELGRGWVLTFAQKLQFALRKPFKATLERGGLTDVDIFLDSWKLKKDRQLEDHLKETVENSATLLIIMSREYLVSDWCEKERNWFFAMMQSRKGSLLRLDDSGEIWPVIVASVGPTDRGIWPHDFIKSPIGYKFYHDETSKADPRYCWPSIEDVERKDKDKFFDELGELTNAFIRQFQRVLEQGTEEATQPQSPSRLPVTDSIRLLHSSPSEPTTGGAAGKNVVLLTTIDHVDDGRRIEAALAAHGITVAYPDQSGRLEAQIGKAAAAVLLLGLPGEESRTALLMNCYNAARNRGIKRFVWIDPELMDNVKALPERRYGSYKALVSAASDDLHRMPLDKLAGALIDALSGSADKSSNGRDMVQVQIYIDAAKSDLDIYRSLDDAINDQVIERLRDRNIDLWHFGPPGKASSQAVYNDFWRNEVTRCDGILIVYGKIEWDAVMSKLLQINKEAAKRRKRIDLAVHNGPPVHELTLRRRDIRIIEAGPGGANIDQVIEFISEIAQRPGNETADQSSG